MCYGKIVAYRIPILGLGSHAMVIFSLMSGIISLWFLIELGFLDGTQGPNKYGPSPKGIIGPQAKPEGLT